MRALVLGANVGVFGVKSMPQRRFWIIDANAICFFATFSCM